MAAVSRIETHSAVLLFLLFLSFADARDHIIGGKPDAWKVPSSESDSLNHWASKTHFRIGDSLVWQYDGSKDSVLQVTKRDYVTCSTSSPLKTYDDGNTKLKLERSEPYFFISGAEGNCVKGQKLIVVVMSQKHHHVTVAAPAPSPAESEGPYVSPAPAPASGSWSLTGGQSVLALALGFLLLVIMH